MYMIFMFLISFDEVLGHQVSLTTDLNALKKQILRLKVSVFFYRFLGGGSWRICMVLRDDHRPPAAEASPCSIKVSATFGLYQAS